MRITRKRWKAAYLVGGYLVLVVLVRVTEWLPQPLFLLLDFAAFSGYIVVSARTFRGKDEPVAPPRPWWKMTARPKAGFWLSVLFAVGVVSFLIPGVGAPMHAFERTYYVAQSAMFAALFLHSSIRLRRGLDHRVTAAA